MDYWIYILHCENNTYYSGYTTDVPRRYQEHCVGSVKCKYTRSFKPIGLVQCWYVAQDKSLALRIEAYLKSLSRIEKEALIHCPKKLKRVFTGISVVRKTTRLKWEAESRAVLD